MKQRVEVLRVAVTVVLVTKKNLPRLKEAICKHCISKFNDNFFADFTSTDTPSFVPLSLLRIGAKEMEHQQQNHFCIVHFNHIDGGWKDYFSSAGKKQVSAGLDCLGEFIGLPEIVLSLSLR